MHLGLDNGEFVVEVAELIVLLSISLDFGGGVPVIKVGNGMTDCVVSGSGAIEKCVEPSGDWLDNILR